jgi:hypothetical protein
LVSFSTRRCANANADEQGKLDWEVHYVDGTVIRAHQHSAGGKKGANASASRREEDEKLGRSRGGFSYINTHTL